jgi:nicotinate-nucleotide adenylyltransferase
MKIGIFGGTFDPPHIGHLILAEEAQSHLKLDRVLWVLTPFPPHKQGQNITLLQHRIKMVQLAIAGNPSFVFSSVDVDRPLPHYAVDTVAILHEKMPDNELFYLMGGDSLRDLTFWHRPIDFVELCQGIGVLRRPGAEFDLAVINSLIPGINGKLQFIDSPLIDISASDIRMRVANGKPFRYLITENIYKFILLRKLYQN